MSMSMHNSSRKESSQPKSQVKEVPSSTDRNEQVSYKNHTAKERTKKVAKPNREVCFEADKSFPCPKSVESSALKELKKQDNEVTFEIIFPKRQESSPVKKSGTTPEKRQKMSEKETEVMYALASMADREPSPTKTIPDKSKEREGESSKVEAENMEVVSCDSNNKTQSSKESNEKNLLNVTSPAHVSKSKLCPSKDKLRSASSSPKIKGPPHIVPKPHTILMPMACEVQDGNKLVLKQPLPSEIPAIVGICDPGDPSKSSLFQRKIHPLLPKPVSIVPQRENSAGIEKGNQATNSSASPIEVPKISAKNKVNSGVSSVAIGIQTVSPPKRKSSSRTKIVTETETQTSGDYILKTAMKSAKIAVKRKSCGAQVTPKGHKRKYESMQSSTQTQGTLPKKIPRKRGARKTKSVAWQTEPLPRNVMVQSVQTCHRDLEGTLLSVTDNTSPSGVGHLPYGVPASSSQNFANPMLYGSMACSLSQRDFSGNVGRTNSTQTHMSSGSNTEPQNFSSMETQTLGSPQHFTTIETQTLNSLGLSQSHTTTQTQAMWDELEKTLAESISTQTFPDPLGESTSTQTLESFLASLDNETTLNTGNPLPLASGSHSGTTSLVTQSTQAAIGSSLSHDPVLGASSLADISQVTSATSRSAGIRLNSPTDLHVTNPINDVGEFGVQTDMPLNPPLSPLSNLLSSGVQTSHYDDTSAYMNIETQTVDDMFEQFLSNMHTQTTDNFLDSMEFSDIQTQTTSAIGSNTSFESSTQTHATTGTQVQTPLTVEIVLEKPVTTGIDAGTSTCTLESQSQTATGVATNPPSNNQIHIHAATETNPSLDIHTQTHVSMEANPSFDNQTQTTVSMDQNQISENGTQTIFSPLHRTQDSSTVETQTSLHSAQALANGIDMSRQQIEMETQTLVQTLSIGDELPPLIDSHTQTAWGELRSPSLK